MNVPYRKPRLFLSYAREHFAFGTETAKVLRQCGFEVFFDHSDIQSGDNFVTTITQGLDRADALVALLTIPASESSWCQAELHRVHALNKRIVPIVWPGSLERLPDPLRRLLADIQYVAVKGDEDALTVVARIAEQLDTVRSARRRNALLRTALGAAGVAAFLGVVAIGVNRLNAVQSDRDRGQLLADVRAATTVLPHEQMQKRAERWRGDRTSQSNLLALATDSTASPVVQLNAVLLATDIAANPRLPFRSVEGIRWDTGTLKNAQLMDTTFVSGRMSHISIQNSHLANVHFGAGGGKPMELLDIDIDLSRMFGGSIRPDNAMNMRIRGTKLYGTEVDITHFSRSTFSPLKPHGPEDLTVTDDLPLFDGAKVISHIQPPVPGTMDLSKPEDVVIFDGVLFYNTRFEGWFNPAWFRNCQFEASELPAGMDGPSFVAGKNVVSSRRTDISRGPRL